MTKTYCPKCNSVAVKNGFQNNRQRYKFKICNNRFQLEYSYQACKKGTNDLIKSLLKESCSVRGISRVIKIYKKTVLSRMLKISKQIIVPYFNKLGCKFELDEMFIKIANGKSQNWLTYAIEQRTKEVISFLIGSKSIENIKLIINKVLLLKPKKIYKDKLSLYKNLILISIHKVFQYCTNRIERKNLTLRMHIKRLSRKTICFSRKEKYIEAHLRIYFWV
ncbi:IS1 family transposase [Pontimicrobium sp. MEBiC06410]